MITSKIYMDKDKYKKPVESIGTLFQHTGARIISFGFTRKQNHVYLRDFTTDYVTIENLDYLVLIDKSIKEMVEPKVSLKRGNMVSRFNPEYFCMFLTQKGKFAALNPAVIVDFFKPVC